MSLLPTQNLGNYSTFITDSRYAPIACLRCRRHATIYNLRYPHRTPPPGQTPREYLFDKQDAKGYLLLKDAKRKLVATDEVLDLGPFIDDHRMKLHLEWTPESDTATPPAENSKKRKRSHVETPELTPKTKTPRPKPEKTAVSRPTPTRRRQASVPSPTPEPQLSEYEKMQLLIANAAKEADSTTRSVRPRRNPESQPEPPTKTIIDTTVKATVSKRRSESASTTPVSPKRRLFTTTNDKVVTGPAGGVPKRRLSTSMKEPEDIVDDVIKSPKVAVYDEWQELLKNAQKEAETGEGRSRRATRRPVAIDEQMPTSPRKRLKADHSVVEAKVTSASTGIKHKASGAVSETVESFTSVVKQAIPESMPVKVETLPKASKKVEKYMGPRDDLVAPKQRRDIRGLADNEIPKVKLEMATVQARYLHDAAVDHPPPSFFKSETPEITPEKPMARMAIEKPNLVRRKSSSQKFAESDVLEENRLFMFAILATEGVQELPRDV
jgi:hypothetical protein